MQHIIKKQILKIDLDNKLDAFRMQHGVAGFYQYEIIPVLEKVFNELSDEETIIAMDKIEIDLGVLTAIEVEKKTGIDIYKAISSQVREAIGNIKLTDHAAPSPLIYSKALNIARQWLFYMQHGYLTWNTIVINDAWYRSVLEAFAVDFESAAALRRLIISSQQSLNRIIYQHTENFLQTLMEILTAEKQTNLLSVANELVRISSSVSLVQNKTPDQAVTVTREKIWALLLTAAAGAEKHLTTERLREKILNRVTVDKIIQKDISANKNSTEPASANTPADIFHQINEEGIFVQYAGLVLLHPFLHSFFKKLQLVKVAEFVSTDAHQKAVFMVHYLATGSMQAEEYELVIPKLLCAYSFDETMPKHIELNEQEMAEANNLLEAAIAQWEILKNTSAAGLREGFLQRNGKLYSKNDNLYLQMETNSIDIVLDYLPWNLSMIKLPWMKELLRVEWR
jgi:Contractile injection system tape measure protein